MSKSITGGEPSLGQTFIKNEHNTVKWVAKLAKKRNLGI